MVHLITSGIRLFQANFGMSDKLAGVTVTVCSRRIPTTAKDDHAEDNGDSELDPEYVGPTDPIRADFFVQDNEVFARSLSPRNPAFEFTVPTTARRRRRG